MYQTRRKVFSSGYSTPRREMKERSVSDDLFFLDEIRDSRATRHKIQRKRRNIQIFVTLLIFFRYTQLIFNEFEKAIFSGRPNLVPWRSRLKGVWTLPWALTSPNSTRQPQASRGLRSFRLCAVISTRQEIMPRTVVGCRRTTLAKLQSFSSPEPSIR